MRFEFLDFVTTAWQRQALVLGCVYFDERHTFFNIAEWMVNVWVDDWQMTLITEMIFSDTDSNQMVFLMMELIWILDVEFEKAVSWKTPSLKPPPPSSLQNSLIRFPTQLFDPIWCGGLET